MAGRLTSVLAIMVMVSFFSGPSRGADDVDIWAQRTMESKARGQFALLGDRAVIVLYEGTLYRLSAPAFEVEEKLDLGEHSESPSAVRDVQKLFVSGGRTYVLAGGRVWLFEPERFRMLRSSEPVMATEEAARAIAETFPEGPGPEDVHVVLSGGRLYVAVGPELVRLHAGSLEVLDTQDLAAAIQSMDQRMAQAAFLIEKDADFDGEVTPEEYGGPEEEFSRLDTNGDGVIEFSEAPVPTGPEKPACKVTELQVAGKYAYITWGNRIISLHLSTLGPSFATSLPGLRELEENHKGEHGEHKDRHEGKSLEK